MTYEPGTSETSVQAVRKELSRRVFAAGATIFAEGEVGTIAYILLRGDVTIFVGFGTADQRTVTELKPGQMFGVHALMADAKRAASALTTHGCELLAKMCWPEFISIASSGSCSSRPPSAGMESSVSVKNRASGSNSRKETQYTGNII